MTLQVNNIVDLRSNNIPNRVLLELNECVKNDDLSILIDSAA